ncbi:MAG: SMI1/KNR4 family protein [Clostridium sp.]|nr:SMI1/KNR4 family protein [Acetatifactor muris]MCM1527152.1 SMI1/KNR4 family protein [Bacteroides sp.]MCM1563467.1 SMI1/KNR4 family protein [Clostridium sp.]
MVKSDVPIKMNFLWRTVMGNLWTEIPEQIKSVSNDIYLSVNAPAELSEIQLLEETIGVKLPSAFCEYLSTLNGQKNTEEDTRDRNAEIPLLGYILTAILE